MPAVTETTLEAKIRRLSDLLGINMELDTHVSDGPVFSGTSYVVEHSSTKSSGSVRPLRSFFGDFNRVNDLVDAALFAAQVMHDKHVAKQREIDADNARISASL